MENNPLKKAIDRLKQTVSLYQPKVEIPANPLAVSQEEQEDL